MNVPNHNAIDGLGSSDVVEVSRRWMGRVHLRLIEQSLAPQMALIQTVKPTSGLQYQRDPAALSQNWQSKRLMTHPLVLSYSRQAVVDAYLQAQQQYIYGANQQIF